jgi:hypothetical protein
VTILPREWVGFSPPITGPAFDPSLVDGIVWHWAGGPIDMRNGEDGALRAMQAAYVSQRGYSLGYSYAVGPSGRCYQIRGLDFRPASNGDTATNRRAPSVLIMAANMGDDVTDGQLRSLRWLTGWIMSQLPQATERYGHRDLWATACPGARWHADIHAGRFDPQPDLPLPPIPPQEDDVMLTIWGHPDYSNRWLIGGAVVHLSPQLYERYIAAGVPEVIERHAQTLASVLTLSATPGTSLVPA